MLARTVGRTILKHGVDYPFAGKYVAAALQSADITFGNLEGCLVGKTVTGSSKAFVFRSPPRFAEGLGSAGFRIMSLANNHAMDGGQSGLISTLEALDREGIDPVGAGRNRAEARQLKVISTDTGWRVGYLAYTDVENRKGSAATASRAGVATVEPMAEMVMDIQKAKPLVDLLIVSYHWGVEYQIGEPNRRQLVIASKAKQAGADIIIGHHPHVLQRIELDQSNKLVAYSLGNFVFDNHRPSRARTLMLVVHVEPHGKLSYEAISCRIVACQPRGIQIVKPAH